MNEVERLVEPMRQLEIAKIRPKDKPKTVKKQGKGSVGERVVRFKEFKHCRVDYLPKKARELFLASKLKAVYYNETLFDKDTDTVQKPELRNDICEISGSNLFSSKPIKQLYVGYDLFQDSDHYNTMTQSMLDSCTPCYEYIKSWQKNYQEMEYGTDVDFTIVSPRHYITDIVMNLFDNDADSEVHLIATHIKNGIVILSNDLNGPESSFNTECAKNPHLKKIRNSGFVFEELLLKKQSEEIRPYFTVVENKLTPKINLLLRCEMDSFNTKKNTYTELKCFNKLRLSNSHHRKKLLKTWIQTGLAPDSDILIGIRETTNGVLEDLMWFSRSSLYHYFDNPNLPSAPKNFQFNANVAVDWLEHSMKSITKLIARNLNQNIVDKPQSFQLLIDTNHNIVVRCLKCVPTNVLIPSELC